MDEIISVSKDSAEITYKLHNEEKAVSIYKKFRNWAGILSTCDTFNEFQVLMKKIKNSMDFTVMSMNFYNKETGLLVVIKDEDEEEDEEEYEEDELDAEE